MVSQQKEYRSCLFAEDLAHHLETTWARVTPIEDKCHNIFMLTGARCHSAQRRIVGSASSLSSEFRVIEAVLRNLNHETRNSESADRRLQCDRGLHGVGNQTILLCFFNQFPGFGCIPSGLQGN